MKIKTKINNNKFIYGDLLKHNNSQPTIFLLSGFSGGRYLPLFELAGNYFFNHNFNVLKFNFCADPDDPKQVENALALKDMTFSVYLSELKNIIYLKKLFLTEMGPLNPPNPLISIVEKIMQRIEKYLLLSLGQMDQLLRRNKLFITLGYMKGVEHLLNFCQ